MWHILFKKSLFVRVRYLAFFDENVTKLNKIYFRTNVFDNRIHKFIKNIIFIRSKKIFLKENKFLIF